MRIIMFLIVCWLAFLLGTAFCFAGYRLFRILITIWGFFSGLLIGASIVSLLGGGFLSTLFSWLVGIAAGLIFAALAYFFFNLAIVILCASVGYWIGTGLVATLGLGKHDFWTMLGGIAVAALLATLIIALDLPKILIMGLTAFAGASTLMVGILLLFGNISVDSLQYGIVHPIIGRSMIWGMVWLVLAIIGFVVQWRSSQQYTLEW